MFLNFIFIFTICFATIPYGITGQFTAPQPEPPDTDILKQSYTELLHNLVKLNNERMGIAKTLNDIESYDSDLQGLSSQIHVDSFNDDDDVRHPSIYLLESPRYNSRVREELDTILKKIPKRAPRTPRPPTSTTPAVLSSSSNPPQMNATPTFTRREANILRAAWNASCTRKAIRKCKKACRKALKKPCTVMRCKRSLKEQFKMNCSKECKSFTGLCSVFTYHWRLSRHQELRTTEYNFIPRILKSAIAENPAASSMHSSIQLDPSTYKFNPKSHSLSKSKLSTSAEQGSQTIVNMLRSGCNRKAAVICTQACRAAAAIFHGSLKRRVKRECKVQCREEYGFKEKKSIKEVSEK